MNLNIKKLITFLTLEPRTDEVNALIGYLNYQDLTKVTTSELVDDLIVFDKGILTIFEETDDKLKVKHYSSLLNKCYSFINEEFSLSFIKQPPFDDNRVANIKDYKAYVLARRLLLDEYEKNKGVSR